MSIEKRKNACVKDEASIFSFFSILISIISLAIVLNIFIYYMDVINSYSDMDQVVRKYTLIMEKDGGLSAQKQISLENELIALGFENISLSGTLNITVPRGEDVVLVVEADSNLNSFITDGLNLISSASQNRIEITKTSISMME